MTALEKAVWHLDVHQLHCQKRLEEAKTKNVGRLFVDHWSEMIDDIASVKNALNELNKKNSK